MVGVRIRLCALSLVVGCTTDISVVATDTGGTPDPGGDAGVPHADASVPRPSACDSPQKPAAAPLRRLTRFEYNSTVRDLLQDNTRPGDTFLPDGIAAGFDNIASAQAVTETLVEQYMNAAESLANAVTADLTRLRALIPCDPRAIGEQACGRQFIETFGRRAFRRPMTPEEVDRYMVVFNFGLQEGGLRTAARLVITALLQSPRFFYRVELGDPSVATTSSDAVALDGYEIASRLSYFIWGSMPDDALFAAAAAGQLNTADQIAVQAKRMLADPKAKGSVDHFGRQWLGLRDFDTLTKDAAYPEFDAQTRDGMLQGSLRLHEDVVTEGKSLTELLTATHVYANRHTAPLYGLTATSTQLTQMTPSEPRAGILTDLAVLSAHAKANQTSPVLRGKMVREQLLCHPLPMPPDNIDITPPPVDPNSTTRTRFEQHREDPTCAGCHVLMDPIGMGLESYDLIGRYRTTENGLNIDATGQIVVAQVPREDFDGAVDLAQVLAESPQVQGCLTKQWFRYAHGRIESFEDACTMEKLQEKFSEGGFVIRDLIVAITRTDAFRARATIVKEACE